MARTIVIGDIHGLLRELQELIGRLDLQASDRVVFLGDLVDKGPSGPEVVRYVRENGWECLLGNHEEMCLRWLKHEDTIAAKRAEAPKLQVAGNPMKKSPEVTEEWLRLSSVDVAWLRSLPIVKDLGGGTVAVHAGFLPGIPIERQHSNDMIRMRWVDLVRRKMVPMEKSPDGLQCPAGAQFWMELWDGPQGVIYGHVVHTLDIPRVDIRSGGVRAWCYGIDTGGVHGGRLTAMVLNDEVSAPEIVQVNADRIYVPFGIHGNGKDPPPVSSSNGSLSSSPSGI